MRNMSTFDHSKFGKVENKTLRPCPKQSHTIHFRKHCAQRDINTDQDSTSSVSEAIVGTIIRNKFVYKSFRKYQTKLIS